jgi:hypothetical protein
VPLPGNKGKHSQLQVSTSQDIIDAVIILWRCTISYAWGGCTTVSLLALLDLQSISLCFVFVFLVILFSLLYTKIQKI